MRRIQIAISTGALAVAAIHIIWPEIQIDAIFLTLFITAILPWLAPLLRSVEFPGGWKIEFQDLERVGAKAEKAGLTAPPSAPRGTDYSFQAVAEEDPNLALAGLRIEIEKRLRALAASRGLEVRPSGIGSLLRALDQEEAISPKEKSALADMLHLLNRAVHGADVDPRASQWALEYGPRLLAALDERRVGGSPGSL